MNAPEAPLSPETLDELLSADIDGELERAALDLGLTPIEVASALATPEAARRRAELARARGLLAAPVPMAPAAESLLVESALDRSTDELRAARSRRRTASRVLVAVGSAAAAVAVILAVAASHPGREQDSKAATAAISPDGPTRAVPKAALRPARYAVAFGDVTRLDVLRTAVETRLTRVGAAPEPNFSADSAGPGLPPLGAKSLQGLKGAEGATGAVGPAPTGVTGAQGGTGNSGIPGPQGAQGLQGDEGIQGDLGLVGPQGPSGLPGPTGPLGPTGPVGQDTARHQVNAPAARVAAGVAAGRSTATCVAMLEPAAHLRSAPVLSGTGTVSGRPVVVAVFVRARSHVVYVLAASDCRVLTRLTLP